MSGCRVGRAAGTESERTLAFAGFHQLCRPFLDRLDRLPAPQQEALGTAVGLRPGGPPDRFMVGLGALSLLTEVAKERPLICLVDDVQWLDPWSVQTLGFVAHRLDTDPVAMILAARDRDEGPPLAGLPELLVPGLASGDAAALLRSTLNGSLDPRVRDRILAESRGNPLALLELSRSLSSPELAFGGSPAQVGGPPAHRLEDQLLRQTASLPEESRRLLLTAAAEPIGDIQLLWRAAGLLGIGPRAVSAAEAAGLMRLRERVEFSHPLVRSAVYRTAPPAARREVHRALAEVTDPETDPDRRAWHLSCAATRPEETIAAALERSAGQALVHGGLPAAAAFLERAAQLTPDPSRRVQRCLDAAQLKADAGAFDDASALVRAADVRPLAEPERARIDLVRARMLLAAHRGKEALPPLLAAARRWEPLDVRRARDAYLDALSAALLAGRLTLGPGTRQVAEAVRSARPSAAADEDPLLEGLAVMFTDGHSPAAPLLHRAVQRIAEKALTVEETLRVAWLAAATAASLWDDVRWEVLTRRHLEAARGAGAFSALPVALTSRVLVHLFTGDLAAGAVLVDEARSVAEVTGGSPAPYGELGLAALRGDGVRSESLVRHCLDEAVSRGEGIELSTLHWARAVLANGLGRYEEAFHAAEEAAADPCELGAARWALVELVEAAVRTGHSQAAAAALDDLTAMTRASGTEWALGVEAGRRALLHDGAAAEQLYRDAVDRLARTTVRVDLARAQLLYGEWLRREGRRVDARLQLRAAHDALSEMGVRAFAQRALHELLATGETVRKRSVESPTRLTDQESRIARLAAEGLSNQEIGDELYLSRRTVEWHLRKVFLKVGVTSRRQLRPALQDWPGSSPGSGS